MLLHRHLLGCVSFLVPSSDRAIGLFSAATIDTSRAGAGTQAAGRGAPLVLFTYSPAMARIRDARPPDAARLAEIHVVSWQVAYRGVLADEFLDRLTSTTRLDWWTSRLARIPPRWAVLVTEDEGHVTGFVSIGHCADDDRSHSEAGELYAMYVDPLHWGLGFGRHLLVGAEERFRADAYTDASLWVLRDNQRARRFYELGGWRADGVEQRMVIGSDAVTAVRYLKGFVGS